MSRPASCLFLATSLLCAVSAGAQVNGPLPAPLPLFPADNWWNLDITNAPVDPGNDGFIAYIGGEGLHPDFGGDADPPEIYGMPYISVTGGQTRVPVVWTDFGDQSDDADPCGVAGYPIPDAAKTATKWIEGGYAGNDDQGGDRHMLIVDRDNKILFELYRTVWNGVANQWEADSGAIWPLAYNWRRPEGWTSAEAGGMAITPGLIRYDEAYGSQPIRHALRVTVHGVCSYVYPASHVADTGCPNAPPLGARLRLKAGTDVSGYPAHIQRIFQAMKTYGLIVADTGTDMYIQGTYNPLWDNDQLNPYFDDLTAADFDVIALGWMPAPNPVPRKQVAVALVRAMQSNHCYTPPVCNASSFSDVTCPSEFGAWIEKAADDGAVLGCGGGKFCPDTPVTRAQLAMFLVRAKNGTVSQPACGGSPALSDVSCGHAYGGWIKAAVNQELLSVCAAGRFCPDDVVTRVQLDQLLANFRVVDPI